MISYLFHLAESSESTTNTAVKPSQATTTQHNDAHACYRPPQMVSNSTKLNGLPGWGQGKGRRGTLTDTIFLQSRVRDPGCPIFGRDPRSSSPCHGQSRR